MKNDTNNKCNQIKLILKAVVVFSISAAIFLIVYQYDNKYTAHNIRAKDGVLVLNENNLTSNPVVFLIDGWEYYGGELFTPKDFENSLPDPDQYMFIGRFGGFEKWNNGNPHGSASYRLNIKIPDKPDTYLLELPEIFSAYRLYINGEQVMQMGEPNLENYKPETANTSVSIKAGGNIEILFAVSDYSHLYSGIVYPPAFGEPDAVSDLLSARLVFRSFLCAIALTVGVLSVMVGILSNRNLLVILFGFLCIYFVGYISYPIIRTFSKGFRVQYALESLCFCAMLGIAILIAIRVSNLPKKWSIPFVGFSMIMCISSVLIYMILPIGNLKLMMIYSFMISAYEWITAGFITLAVVYAIKKGTQYIVPLLYGIIIFVCALIADRLLPLHEPIYTGWFIELASFALVLCIGVVIGDEVANGYRESAVMFERANSMERLYKSQLVHLETLKNKIDETKIMRHDMRHHITVINEYIQNKKYHKLKEYIDEYHINSSGSDLIDYCPIDIINTLTHHYYKVSQQNNIHIDIRYDLKVAKDPGYTKMTDLDLCCLYANLMENAVEACERTSTTSKMIRVAVFRTSENMLHIHVKNSAENVKQTSDGFISSKKEKRIGYGLASIEDIVHKYNGQAKFKWNENKKEFESRIVVLA